MTGDSKPWLTDEPDPGAMKHAPATQRNRDAILTVLREELPERGTVLEIASGSGEHIVHFAQALPDLLWQPSDPDPECRASIRAWIDHLGCKNVVFPLALDVLKEHWPLDGFDAVICINMIHIAPWAASIGLFRHGAALLPVGAPLYLYGPFFRDDVETAPSNLDFDASLRSRNPKWGIRDLADIDDLAARHGFARTRLEEMPANNLSLVYRKPA